MAARKGARWLAPLALAATVAAIYILVHRELDHRHTSTTSSVVTHTSTGTSTTRRVATSSPSYYVVRPGDTLSAISLRTHVSLGQLEALNPSLKNPDALQTGQRLLIRR